MARIKEEDLRLNLIINGDETRKKMSELKSTITDTTKKLTDLEKERKKVIKQYGEESAQVKQLDARIDAHRKGIKNAKDAYADYERRLKLTGMTMSELSQHARATAAVLRNMQPGTPKWKELNEELRKTRQRMRELQAESGKTGKAMEALSQLKSGALAAVATVAGIARVFAGAVGTMKDFEQANVNLSTILGKSVSDIAELTSEAQRLGRTTEYTATEVTGLQTELAKLGFNESQIRTMEEPVLHFATAVGADLPEAAALAGSTLRMFGLSTKDTEDTLATLAIATNKSALSFSFFQDAMSTIGPVANTFGFGVKDTTALLGTLANAGFDASSAATATRNILLKLADANGDLAKALGGPVSTFDDLIDGLRELDEQGIDLAGTLELTDKRSVAAFNSFLRGADSAAILRGELENTDGVLKDIAEQRMNTLDGSLKKLKSAWEGFILSMKKSTGVLKSVVDYLTEIVSWVTPGNAHNKDVEMTVETITAGYGTAKGRAYVAEQKQKDLQSQLDRLDADLEKANDRRSKRRIKREKKRIEKELSVYQDAYSRLKSAADAEDEEPVTTTTGTGNKNYSSGKQSAKEQKAAAKKAAQEQKKAEQEAKKAAQEAAEAAKKAAQEKKELAELEKTYLNVYISVIEDHEEKAKAQEKAEDLRYKEELEKYQKKSSELKNYQQIVETLERQHQNNLRKIRLDAMEAERKDLEAQHKVNLAAIQERFAYELNSQSTRPREKADKKRKNAHDTAAENVAYLQAQAFSLQRIVSSGTANGNLDGLKLSNQELQKYRLQLLETLKQLREAQAQLDGLEKKSPGQMLKDMFVGTGNGSFLGVSQSDWDLLFQNIEEGTLGAKDLGTMLTAVGSAAEEGMKIATQAIGTVNAREKKAFDDWSKLNDKKKSDLEKSLAAGLVTQAQYNAEVEQMEADKAAREEEMKLTQAKREKTMALIQAAINTALSVTKTIAQFGIPAGIAPAAIAAAMGAAQIALIASKPVGYAGGGKVRVKRAQDGRSFRAEVEPEKRGYVGRPTILVGEEGGEYVIPAEGVKNPSLAPILATIESAHKQGTLRNLDFGAIYPEGRAAGGRFIQADQPSQSPVDLSGISSTLSEIQSLLETIRESPIPAYLPIVGKNGMDKQVKKYNQYRATGKLQ